MAGNRTFTMIKPDAVKAGHAGAILAQIEKAGFRFVAMKLTRLSRVKAGEFYAIHKERPFYQELVEFMSSGPIVAAVLARIAMPLPVLSWPHNIYPYSLEESFCRQLPM